MSLTAAVAAEEPWSDEYRMRTRDGRTIRGRRLNEDAYSIQLIDEQGLVKVMNHYLSTMSGPIRSHRGIIDKYIGDAIMAYWGPPFTEHSEQARLACLAASW